jgi:hypothetical protein
VGHSAPVSVFVDNSRPPDVIGKDAELSMDDTGIITTPSFSTTTPNDLLVAFVAYNGPPSSPQTATVTGAGLGWQLLKRSNAQHGTSEVWTARASGLLSNVTVSCQPGSGAYGGSLTVTAFTHALGTGVVGQASAPSGAPDIFLPGVAAGSWVFAVGNDWDNAIPRTPVAGQVLVHEWVDGATVEIVATRQPGSPLLVPPGAELPRALSLSSAFPNPTNGGVELRLALPQRIDVSLSVLDIQGREVWRTPTRQYGPGTRSLGWDGRSGQGPVRSGIYLARVRAGEQILLRRFAIIR